MPERAQEPQLVATDKYHGPAKGQTERKIQWITLCKSVRGVADGKLWPAFTSASRLDTSDKKVLSKAANFINAVSGFDTVNIQRKFKSAWKGKLRMVIEMASNGIPDFGPHTPAMAAAGRDRRAMTLANMRANGVRKLGIIHDPARDARQGGTVQR